VASVPDTSPIDSIRLPGLRRLRLETEDRLRYSPALCNHLARVLSLDLPFPTRPGDPVPSIVRLCRAARYSTSASLTLRIEEEIRNRVAKLKSGFSDWSRFEPGCERNRIEKGVVLKAPIGEHEKGVLLVSFEYQWFRLLQVPDLEDFASRYTLVLAPSWSPPHSPGVCVFPARFPSGIFTLISHENDLKILPRLSPKFVVVPLYASNWVNPDLYQPVPFENKDIDIFVASSFARYKRHFVLFRALRKMPRTLRIRLVGQPVGARNAASLLREAKDYGVADRFEFLENVSDEEMCRTFCRSKISLILSRREGSCVSVVESMLADTPVGILQEAQIGSRVFLNRRTGCLLNESSLARQLMRFLEEAQGYSPRQWALDNRICCFGSTQVLNRFLKQRALDEGRPWTQDIAVHHWRPDPRLVFQEDRARLQRAYDDIHARYGLQIG
jgi:glycosyltransferase involved in cell wall biosynthesis